MGEVIPTGVEVQSSRVCASSAVPGMLQPCGDEMGQCGEGEQEAGMEMIKLRRNMQIKLNVTLPVPPQVSWSQPMIRRLLRRWTRPSQHAQRRGVLHR